MLRRSLTLEATANIILVIKVVKEKSIASKISV